ncbi:MAG TPA: hypothetical protein PK014_08370 [Thermoanaerobaculia bacterium]|nr:hypothetical protein [Thermoanaerobaculia bacterium]HUM30157.1 hypothetical protein [Thermoanaerobaculia bacterium]HXK68393.1 hypothetical protein [Thermoanaerobaculia bacterium]
MENLELIEYTRRVWEPKYGRTLSDEECEEIIHNVKEFVFSLMEIQQNHPEEVSKEKENVEEKTLALVK